MRFAVIVAAVVIEIASAFATPPPETCLRGPTLWEQTEAAVDRGNGRVVDEQTYTVESIRVDRVLSETQRFWVERERELRIDQAQQKSQVEEKRAKVVELESVRLAAERERWIRMMNKARHGEAAVVDAQIRDSKSEARNKSQ